MEQLSFFKEPGRSVDFPRDLIEYTPALFDLPESEYLLNKFIKETDWKQPVVKMYDKELLTPRLNAWFGDTSPGSYLIRKIPDARPWTSELLMIKDKVENLAGVHFNSVLLNYYRDGNDSVAWHSDKDSAPGTKTVVASVSFGQVRSFDIRNKLDHSEKYSIKLEDGSYLLMKVGLQECWEHRIAKSAKIMKPRINLTFRLIR
jgi:alkylated DNA repair dioxygenase AlkB